MTSTPPEPPVWPAFPAYQPPAFSPPPASPPPPPDLPRWYDYRVWTYRSRRLIV